VWVIVVDPDMTGISVVGPYRSFARASEHAEKLRGRLGGDPMVAALPLVPVRQREHVVPLAVRLDEEGLL